MIAFELSPRAFADDPDAPRVLCPSLFKGSTLDNSKVLFTHPCYIDTMITSPLPDVVYMMQTSWVNLALIRFSDLVTHILSQIT